MPNRVRISPALLELPAGARNRIKATVKIRKKPSLQILPLILFLSGIIDIVQVKPKPRKVYK